MPKRKEPRFELVLRNVRVKSRIVADPATQFSLGVVGIFKPVLARIDIRKGNHRVRSAIEKVLDELPEFIFLRNQAIIGHSVEPGHSVGESGFQERPQVRKKRFLSLALNEECNPQARPPILPILQTSSKV